MLTQKMKVMGVTVSATLPSTIEELLALPGATEEKIFQAALKHVKYHCWFSALRSAFVRKLVEGGAKVKIFLDKKEVLESDKLDAEGKKTGSEFTFATNGKVLNDEQIDLLKWETEEVFFKRHCAEVGVEVTSFASQMQEIVDQTPINMNVREATEKVAKINRSFINLAVEIFQNDAQDRVAKSVGNSLGEEITFTGDRDEDIKILALAIQTKEKAEEKNRLAKFLAAI